MLAELLLCLLGSLAGIAHCQSASGERRAVRMCTWLFLCLNDDIPSTYVYVPQFQLVQLHQVLLLIILYWLFWVEDWRCPDSMCKHTMAWFCIAKPRTSAFLVLYDRVWMKHFITGYVESTCLRVQAFYKAFIMFICSSEITVHVL